MKSGEDGPARLNQDMVNLEAESSMAEYAAIEGRRVEDEPARLNQDMIHLQELEAESVDDVFLSFSGSDNLFWFAGSIYRRLVAAGITVFRDDGTLGTLSEELPLSVRSFKIYIPIFSRTYADCPRCLDALTLMVEHASRSGGKEEILPVFYDVERSDVQLGKKSLYDDALDTHRGSLGDGKVEKWKKALVEAVKVKGWELRSYNSQAELVTSIAREISLKLKVEHNYVLEDLFTGADPMLSYRTLPYAAATFSLWPTSVLATSDGSAY